MASLDSLPSGIIGPAVVAILALFLLNGLYVASETAIECLRPLHFKSLREIEIEAKSKLLQKLIEKRPQMIAATTIGAQTARFLIVIVAMTLSPALVSKFSPELGPLSSLIIATLIIALPLLIANMVLELVPRSYSSLHPERVGTALYRFIVVSSIVFSLPAMAVTSVANLATTRFGGKASFALPNQAEEEIKNIVEVAQESGEIEEEEKEMLHSVFEFSDTVVREVMTPRVDIDALPVNSEAAEAVDLIRRTGHSRIPLYENTDDAIVGIVHAKDLLLADRSGRKVTLRSLMRPPIFVPENKDLHDLLREMRLSRSQMAVVQDEFGGTSGIVTIEDIVEEVVGDIIDEYDVEEPQVVQVEDAIIADGRTHLDEVSKYLDDGLSSEEFDTIGGYIFGLFGRQPSSGESIQEGGFLFTIEQTDGRRIQKVRIEKAPPASSEEAQS